MITLADLPDDFTPQQFKQLDKASLDAVPYTRCRWLCQAKGCTNGTHVRDYGLGEFSQFGIWGWLDRNSKNATKNPQEYWIGPNNYWLCGKHNKLFKRLRKRFDFDHVWRRLIDMEKPIMFQVNAANMATVKQIEKKPGS